MKGAARFARAVSWLGHPLVFISISVAVVVATQLAASAAFPILAALFFSVILPTAILLVSGVRSGRWRDADVSIRQERKRFYPWAIGFSALGTLISWVIGAPGFIVRGGLITLTLFMIAALANFWLKISLHVLFAAYCTTILFRINCICGTVAMVIAGLVFWARLFLARHTLVETLAGAALGVSGGVIASWWPDCF
jgi:hypothetical protein